MTSRFQEDAGESECVTLLKRQVSAEEEAGAKEVRVEVVWEEEAKVVATVVVVLLVVVEEAMAIGAVASAAAAEAPLLH